MSTMNLLLSLLTALFGSLIALFVAGISQAGFPYPLTILKWRLFAAALVFYGLTLASKRKPPASLPWKVLLFHGLVPTFAAMLLFFYSICIGTPPGLATFLFYLFPVSNMLWGRLFLSELPTTRAWAALGLSVAGLFLLLWQKPDASTAGVVSAFMAGNLFGLGVVCHRWYKLRGLSTRVINFHVFMTGALAAIILDAAFLYTRANPYGLSGTIELTIPVVWNFTGLILLGTVLFFSLLSHVSGRIENYLLSIVLTLEPALTTILSVTSVQNRNYLAGCPYIR
ncbi:MAG: DMT family transporter [Candidatus Wallbacteria bacterium]|nr:DMT family transporter [Candidatus Wallbacteria bacterium]